MGDKGILIRIVESTRDQMRAAQEAATNTPRPVDACPSHDALFALTKAQTEALDTLLMLKQDELTDSSAAAAALAQTPPVPASEPVRALVIIRALTPWRWPLAVAVFSPFAGDVVSRVAAILR